MATLPTTLPTIEAIGHGVNVGDKITMEMTHWPSWWRRVLLREGPSTRMETFIVKATHSPDEPGGFVEIEREVG